MTLYIFNKVHVKNLLTHLQIHGLFVWCAMPNFEYLKILTCPNSVCIWPSNLPNPFCWFLSSLGGIPNPRVQGLEGGAPQESLVGLEPKVEVLHPSMFGPNPWILLDMWWMEMIEDIEKNPMLQKSLNSEISLMRYEFLKLTMIFLVFKSCRLESKLTKSHVYSLIHGTLVNSINTRWMWSFYSSNVHKIIGDHRLR